MPSENKSTAWRLPQIGLILVGCVVLVLLFVADKSHLNNDPDEAVAGEMPPKAVRENNTDQDDLLATLPPPEQIQGYQQLQDELSKVDSDELKAEKLKALVGLLRDNNRPDLAAVYAGQLADLKPEVRNLLVAGALFREAVLGNQEMVDEEMKASFYSHSIEFLEKARELEPENQDVLIELGLAYVESPGGQTSMQGIQSLLKVVELNPDNEEALFHLGVFSLRTGQQEKAVDRFKNVVRINPENLEATYFLGNLYLELEQSEKAVPLLRKLAGQEMDLVLRDAAQDILSQL